MKTQALLSIAYLAPVQYYSKFCLFEKIIIEQFENYSKQTYRNRCIIASANGPLVLSIPVERTESLKIPIRDTRIEYRTNWQKIHFKAIESAYKNAPYYLYYIDDLIPFYTKNHKFLFDFNIAIQEVILKNIGLSTDIIFTEDYISQPWKNCDDFRESIHPKPRLQKKDSSFSSVQYPQVFDLKYNFIPNLSILDLLFNAGPDAKDILRESII